MSNQQKPPEFSEIFLLFSCLVTSLLQAACPQWGVGWSRDPVGGFGQGMLSLALPHGGVWVALSGAGLAWTLLSFLPELQTPLTLPAFQLRCPWLVLTSAFSMLVLREQEYEYQCPHTSLWLSP